MNLLIAVLGILFLTMGSIGLARSKSDWWNLVDLVYYPMVAIGVVLLFVNTSSQRQLFDLAQQKILHKDRIADLARRQPSVNLSMTGALVDSSFDLVGTIDAFAKVCRYPGNVDARCSAAEALQGPSKSLLEAAKAAPGLSVEDRLAKACPVADALILGTGDGKGMSSLVGQELVAQYKSSREKKLSFAAYDELERDAAAFERFAQSRIGTIRSIIKSDPRTSEYIEGVYASEVEFGKLLLAGLLPCIVSDRKEIDALTNWKRIRQTEEESLKALEADRQKISTADALFPWLARIQYYVWPYLIGIALSLKFGKGVATWKKHRPPQPEKAVASGEPTLPEVPSGEVQTQSASAQGDDRGVQAPLNRS